MDWAIKVQFDNSLLLTGFPLSIPLFRAMESKIARVESQYADTHPRVHVRFWRLMRLESPWAGGGSCAALGFSCEGEIIYVQMLHFVVWKTTEDANRCSEGVDNVTGK